MLMKGLLWPGLEGYVFTSKTKPQCHLLYQSLLPLYPDFTKWQALPRMLNDHVACPHSEATAVLTTKGSFPSRSCFSQHKVPTLPR